MKKTSAQGGFWKTTLIFLTFSTLLILMIVALFTLDYAVPGDISYPIKTIIEEIRLGANELNFRGRAQIFTELSNQRKEEVKLLMDKKRYTQVTETVDQMILVQSKAISSIKSAIGKAENVSVDIDNLYKSIDEQAIFLNTLLLEAPASDYEQISQQIVRVLDNLEQIEGIRSAPR